MTPSLFDRLSPSEQERVDREDPWLAGVLRACRFGSRVSIPHPAPSKLEILREYEYWHVQMGFAPWNAYQCVAERWKGQVSVTKVYRVVRGRPGKRKAQG